MIRWWIACIRFDLFVQGLLMIHGLAWVFESVLEQLSMFTQGPRPPRRPVRNYPPWVAKSMVWLLMSPARRDARLVTNKPKNWSSKEKQTQSPFLAQPIFPLVLCCGRIFTSLDSRCQKVTSPSFCHRQCQALVNFVQDLWDGKLDGLVNNVGTNVRKAIHEAPWRTTLPCWDLPLLEVFLQQVLVGLLWLGLLG